MKPYDYMAMRGLVKESVPASKLYHAHKSALKAAGPKTRGSRRQFARECEKQSYKGAYDEVRDKPEYAQVRAKYAHIYERIEQSHEHELKAPKPPASTPARPSVSEPCDGSESSVVAPHVSQPRAPGTWIEMRTTDGKADTLLVQYDPEESARVLERLKGLELSGATPWHGGHLGGAIVDQLSSACSIVASGLQTGQIFQVIGTPHLVEGLRAGTHVLVQTPEGLIGTVRLASTPQFAGQLRFAPASMAPVLAPVLAWQVLHAIAGTTQLRKINNRLDVMQRNLETLQARQEAAVLGRVRWAVNTLDDILAERANTGTFTPEMDTRLADVDKTIGPMVERNRVLVDSFRTKAATVHRLGGKTGAVSASALLKEEGPQAVHDMRLLMGLVAADMRVQEARLYRTMECNPKDVQRRLHRVTEKVGEYREALDNLPSVEGLERHAKVCVEEMGWWQRNVFARGVVDEVSQLSKIEFRDVKVPNASAQLPATGSYVFWKDQPGATQVRMLPSHDLEE